ncbi:MAG: hypothetical protein IJO33_02890 [Bacilli bacterium]|nr:hypothetical protein [Bacilli bacterium]
MSYKDEDTKIFDLIEENNEQGNQKEVNNNPKRINGKMSLKNRWNMFSKKQKILIICLIVLLIVVLVVGIIFLCKEDNKKIIKQSEEPKIVIENKNYRFEDGNLILLNDNEEEIGKYECKNKENEKCYVAYNVNEDDLDETKYVYENGKNLNTQTPIVNDTYVFIYDNDSDKDSIIRLYNIKEKKVEETYALVKKAINNDSYYIVVNTEGAYGLIQITENGISQIIKFDYEYLAISDKSVQRLENIIAKINDKYFLINQKEERLSKPIDNRIVGYNDNYLKVKDLDNTYSVYDYKGNKVLKENYEYIYLIENYMGIIKDKLLYIVDANEKYLNMDGIKLTNTYYNKTYIYDENDKMLEIKYAADIDINDKIINIITINNEKEKNYEINILESIVNNKLNYVSYIDGKLYFYSDEEKQTLIGTYPCKNKNIIVDENSTLENCYLATESYYSSDTITNQVLGYLPLINNRYVFIKDVLDITNNSIVLYDLVDKKTLSTYLSVDAGIYTGKLSLTFYDTEKLNIMALSAKKNKYGMISITKEGVYSLLDFSNAKIEKLKDYYLINRSSGTYALMDSNKNFITKEYSYKIVDYYKNFVKTIDNTKFRLFDFLGNEITNESYDYIALYENNYVAIKDNKLTVSSYDKTVLIKDVELKLKDYDNAYAIDSSGVTIYKEDKTYDRILFVKEENNGEE